MNHYTFETNILRILQKNVTENIYEDVAENVNSFKYFFFDK